MAIEWYLNPSPLNSFQPLIPLTPPRHCLEIISPLPPFFPHMQASLHSVLVEERSFHRPQDGDRVVRETLPAQLISSLQTTVPLPPLLGDHHNASSVHHTYAGKPPQCPRRGAQLPQATRWR